MDIETPEPEQSRGRNIDFATECAFSMLISRAISDGLLPPLSRPLGLMYLPAEAPTQQFKDGCRAVIECLEKAAREA